MLCNHGDLCGSYLKMRFRSCEEFGRIPIGSKRDDESIFRGQLMMLGNFISQIDEEKKNVNHFERKYFHRSSSLICCHFSMVDC